MFKKCLTIFLAAFLTLTSIPAIALPSFATDGADSASDVSSGNGAEAIAAAFDESHLVATKELADDGAVGIPVTIKTYADKTKYTELGASADTAMETTADGRKYEVIVYIIGHNEERIGQESDVSILTDYLGQGYIVVVLDYKNHELAIASQLEFSIQKIRKNIQTSGTYLGDLAANRPAIKKDCNFALPAGFRLARNVAYYNLLDNGIAGTAEQIVKCWNDTGTGSNTFKNAKTSKIPACEYNNNTKGVFYEVTSVEQMVRPDPVTGEAIPLDFNLYLDIIYPSDPTRETPVYMNSSSHEQREGESVGNGGILQTGLALRGYTTAVYDHEYFPMARDDHYGYFIGTYGYGMAKQIGVKTHSAAVRCVRYYAAELGYSEYDGYSAGGGSKASYCSILGSDEPNDRAELASFSGGPFNTTDYTTAGQPWLTYSDKSAMAGQEISARIEGVVSFMGDGTNLHAQIVNADTSATVIACGIFDQYGAWDKWPATQATYMNYDVPNLAISMYDLGHAWPVGVDSVLQYDRSQAMIEFLYYWANTEDVAPRVIYTSPYDGDDRNKNEEPIVIHFAGDIPLTEIQTKVRIIDVTDSNRELTGTWVASAGNNKFEFTSSEAFVNGHTYQIVIPETVTDSRGLSMEKAVTTTFVSAADIQLAAIKDAYIVSGSTVNTGSESTIKLSGDTSKGYLEFDVSSIKADSTMIRLAISVEDDATNTVQVWALAEDAAAWEEDTIVWDNAPAASTLVGSISVTGAGRYMLDITDYVAALEGNTVRLVLVNKLEPETVYDQSFDDLAAVKNGANVANLDPVSYSDTYHYRHGGAPASHGLSSEEDHTTGSGKSFKLVRNHDYDRIKLYNSIKSSALTEDDIGTTYRATFWVKTDADVEITAGLMMAAGTYGTSFYGTTSSTAVPANTWTQCELVYTLDSVNVENQAAMLTIQGSGTSTLYIDDVHVEILATDVTVSSREGTSAPTLRVDTSKAAVTIGKTNYATFEDAMMAVPTDGTATTILLQEDVKLSGGIAVTEGMDLTIDLNGFTMTAENLSNISGSTAPVSVKGSLKIGNGNFICTGSTQYTFHVWASGTDNGSYLEFMDGLYIDSEAGYGIVQVGNQTANEGTFVMREDVTIKTVYLLIYAYPGSDATIYGGDVENTVGAMIFYFAGSNEKVIWGGTYKSVPTNGSQLFRQVTGLVLKGGTYSEYTADRNGTTPKIGDGYALMENDDGTYTVQKAEAKIGNTLYSTFAEALAAVPTDGTATTITLLQSVTVTNALLIPAGMNLTLDLADHTLTLSGTAQPSGHFGSMGVKGSLKIGNGNLVIDGAKQYGIHVHNTGTNSGAYLEFMDGLTVTMDNSVGTHGLIQVGHQSTNSGEFVMRSGVNITSQYKFLYAYQNSTFTIYGGNVEVTDVRQMFYTMSNNTERVIRDGTFTSNANSGDTYKLFRQGHGIVLWGGTFSEAIEANAGTPALGENRTVVDNGDGTYTVKKIHYVGNPVDFTHVSEAEPDKNFGSEQTVLLSGENGKNIIALAEFSTAELANMEFFRIPVSGTADQKISVAVIDGWGFDSSTVTYNSVQDKLWAELMTTEKAGKYVGRYTIGTAELNIAAEDILSKVTGDTFTLVLQADEKYVFEQNFDDRTAHTISEGATQGVIGSSLSGMNVIYDETYMASRGGYVAGCAIAFVNAAGKDGQNSMMFRVTKGGQRYKFYNALGTDKMTVLDIGRTFRISLDIMTTKALTGNMHVSLQCRTDGDGTTSPTAGGTAGGNAYANYASNWRYQEQAITTTANVWQTVTFEVTVDELMVNHQIGILGLNFGDLGSTEHYYYIDNIKVEEINGNDTATATSLPEETPVAFVDDRQVELGENVTIIEADVKIGTLDTDATVTNLITHDGTVLLAVNNLTGALFFEKDGTAYLLCDAKGNIYTVSTDAIPVAAILDKSAGTVRYAVNGKLAYYLDGETVTNTYGTVLAPNGFGTSVTVGAAKNRFGSVDTDNVTATAVNADAPRIIGSQMSTTTDAVRVLSGIDSLYYSEIGFIVTRGDGAEKSWTTSVVFTSVNALGTPETAEELGCKYLTGFVINGLADANDGDTFTAIPVVYVDTVELRGEAVTFTIAKNGTTVSVSTVK